ncbi:hypothetical protein GGR52DRAFT_509624 [Hypoxylon sp. FL1284]|nr:hypothetical protein GGR52DRAFT_509624 [Hypoxylon sp. FL1284]
MVAQQTMMIIVCLYGNGTHLWDVSIASYFKFLYYGNIANILYCATMFPLKAVMLFQIRSIFFQHDHDSFRSRAVTFLMWFNPLAYIALGLSFTLSCTPREKIWHPYVEGHCIYLNSCIAAMGFLNVASHLSILLIPVLSIAKLKMSLKRKILAGSVFALGIFATAAAVARLYYSFLLLYGSEDLTWWFMPLGYWTSVEFMMGFVIIGAPYVPRLVESLSSRSKPGSSYPSYDTPDYRPRKLSSFDGR